MPIEESMVLAALDLCFNLLCERLLLGVGARTLWLTRLGAVPLEEQMQSTGPALCAGVLTCSLALAALCVAIPRLT